MNYECLITTYTKWFKLKVSCDKSKKMFSLLVIYYSALNDRIPESEVVLASGNTMLSWVQLWIKGRKQLRIKGRKTSTVVGKCKILRTHKYIILFPNFKIFFNGIRWRSFLSPWYLMSGGSMLLGKIAIENRNWNATFNNFLNLNLIVVQ